jgi:hypothetical protein
MTALDHVQVLGPGLVKGAGTIDGSGGMGLLARTTSRPFRELPQLRGPPAASGLAQACRRRAWRAGQEPMSNRCAQPGLPARDQAPRSPCPLAGELIRPRRVVLNDLHDLIGHLPNLRAPRPGPPGPRTSGRYAASPDVTEKCLTSAPPPGDAVQARNVPSPARRREERLNALNCRCEGVASACSHIARSSASRPVRTSVALS